MDKSAWATKVRRVEKPWGHEVHFAVAPGRYCGKELYVRAGEALSLQYHEVKEETVYVRSGTLRLDIGPSADALQTYLLEPGEAFHVAPGTVHRMTGETDVVLLEASTTELDDVVRLEDRYGREGTSTP